VTPADYLQDLHADPALKPFRTEYTLDFTQNQAAVRQKVTAVAAALQSELAKRPPAELVRQRAGRVIDERVAPHRAAPETHLVLQLAPGWEQGGEYEPPHAVARGEKLADDALKTGETPAVVARTEGEGQVVVLGYSPFAPDLWRTDTGPSDWLNDPLTPKQVDGWGVQRLLDLAQLTARRSVPGNRPVVRGAREAADGATLFLDCWADLPSGGAWDTPEVWTAPSGQRAARRSASAAWWTPTAFRGRSCTRSRPPRNGRAATAAANSGCASANPPTPTPKRQST
jgi:hypothetical protein